MSNGEGRGNATDSNCILMSFSPDMMVFKWSDNIHLSLLNVELRYNPICVLTQHFSLYSLQKEEIWHCCFVGYSQTLSRTSMESLILLNKCKKNCSLYKR